jgi:nucleoside-diphosphate-sugar epimerase
MACFPLKAHKDRFVRRDTLGTAVRVLVTGPGGFIGHHLVSPVSRLLVRGVDLKGPKFCDSDANEFELLDLRRSAGLHAGNRRDRGDICI